MMSHRPFLPRLVNLAFFTSMITVSAAADPIPATLDFAFHLSRLDITLNDTQQVVDTTVKRIGITSFDLRQQPLRPGVAVGYAYVSDSSQAVTAGMELVGYYFAPSLRGMLLNGERLRAALTATYLYQHVKDSIADRSVTMDWQQAQVDLDARWRVSRQLDLLLGGQYGGIDVDENLSGNINQTLKLHTGPTLGYRAGLEFDLGDDGQVGMVMHRDLGDGVEIYFQRQF